jgi:hypothetical protein
MMNAPMVAKKPEGLITSSYAVGAAMLGVFVCVLKLSCITQPKAADLSREQPIAVEHEQAAEADGDVRQWSIGSIVINNGGSLASGGLALAVIGGLIRAWRRERQVSDRMIVAIEEGGSVGDIKRRIRECGLSVDPVGGQSNDAPGRLIAKRVRKLTK